MDQKGIPQGIDDGATSPASSRYAGNQLAAVFVDDVEPADLSAVRQGIFYKVITPNMVGMLGLERFAIVDTKYRAIGVSYAPKKTRCDRQFKLASAALVLEGEIPVAQISEELDVGVVPEVCTK